VLSGLAKTSNWDLFSSYSYNVEKVSKSTTKLTTAISTPTQLIHAAILDLLRDVPDKAIEAGDITQLCDIVRLSTSTTIQCTAYGVLSRVIKTKTVGLVLEAECAPEDEPIKISLPTSLTGIFTQLDWQSELALPAALAQLLAWMAVLDHFEDAVSVPLRHG
jgi:hypothetical protein